MTRILRKPSIFCNEEKIWTVTCKKESSTPSCEISEVVNGDVKGVLHKYKFKHPKEYEKKFVYYQQSLLLSGVTQKVYDLWGIDGKELNVIVEHVEQKFRNVIDLITDKAQINDMFDKIYDLLNQMHSYGLICEPRNINYMVNKTENDESFNYRLVISSKVDPKDNLNNSIYLTNFNDILEYIDDLRIGSQKVWIQECIISNIKRINNRLLATHGKFKCYTPKKIFRIPDETLFEDDDSSKKDISEGVSRRDIFSEARPTKDISEGVSRRDILRSISEGIERDTTTKIVKK